MTLKTFITSQLPHMPWKNGGGLTREIACLPAGSNVQDFHWRLSIAEIAASGGFSVFAGVDRVITLIEGDGMRLHGANAAIDHKLTSPAQPFAFSGDSALDCDLLAGPCQDFNVMVRRSFGAAHVALHTAQWALPANGALLVRSGQWHIQGPDGSRCTVEPAAADGAFWSALQPGYLAIPNSSDAQLLVVTITAHA